MKSNGGDESSSGVRSAASTGESNEVVLQHGSILCGRAHRRLVDYLHLAGEDVRERMRAELEENTIDLSAILHRPVDPEEIGRVCAPAALRRVGY